MSTKSILSSLVILFCTLSATAHAESYQSGTRYSDTEFTRTTTCGPNGPQPCKPGQVPRPISWHVRCVDFFVNQDGSTDFSNNSIPKLPDEALLAVIDGFYAWNAPVKSNFQYRYGGTTNETLVRGEGEAPNLNAVIWRDVWPDDSPTAIATTSISYLPSTGQILDADIEVNTSPDYKVTVPPMTTATDLQNTITHEAGHFLGLSHTRVPDATMYGTAQQGEIKKRTLKPVDIAGLAAIYPASYNAYCPPAQPPHFHDVNKASASREDRGCSSTGDPNDSLPLLSLLALAALFTRRRTR